MKKDEHCPWCGAEQTELWELGLGDGDTHETECQSCEKKIEISCTISVDWEVSARGCEPHEFVKGKYFFGGTHFSFYCQLCKEEFYDWHLPGKEHQTLEDGKFKFVGEAEGIARQRGLIK